MAVEAGLAINTPGPVLIFNHLSALSHIVLERFEAKGYAACERRKGPCT